GEVQLALLLEQFLSPDQYVKNASVGSGGRERVEYAVKFPADGEQVLLPIDSKFPREDYEHLQEAIAAGDAKLITHFRRELEAKIKAGAKKISRKYINPPHTLEFAILFVPTESLYAEILRQPGLSEQLQRDYRVMIAGPSHCALSSSQAARLCLDRAVRLGVRLEAVSKEIYIFDTEGRFKRPR